MSVRTIIILIFAIIVALYLAGKINLNAVQLNNEPAHCQYPGRTTNTPTTCDNTDPCDPSNIKMDGDGSCITPVSEIQESYNIITGK